MKVGYHAPLPPAATGVAAYANSLSSALKAYCDPIPNAPLADIHLYQLGNNQLHRSIYERALRTPGVILLHDANLNHFYLGALSRGEYIREFCRQYGAWYADFAGQLYDHRALSAADERYFRYPMLAKAVTRAKAVLVHNRAAARITLAHGARCPVFEIPHLFEPPPVPALSDVSRLRQSLGLSGEDYLLGVFGFLRESKRLAPILRAFEKGRSINPRLRLLIAGEFVSPTAETAMPEVEGVIRVPGILPESGFWLHAHAVDACINLRYPSCGETSGIAIRLMGIGRPVLITAGDEYAAMPEGTHIPIDSGLPEDQQLTAWMQVLAANPQYGIAVGDRARRHIGQHHRPSEIARRICRILDPLQ